MIQRVPPVPFQALKADPVFGQSSHIQRNLQGTSGQLLKRAEYEAIIRLIEKRGGAFAYPKLPEVAEVDLTGLGNERDVEVKLVEPLLTRLGLTQWVRQLSVRLGRGERVYPDYALGVTGEHPEIRAQALIEVKYRTAGERDWREAFFQAKAYAMRLGAAAFLVASADGVRLYRRESDDFQFESGEAFDWTELQDEVLLQISKILSGARRHP